MSGCKFLSSVQKIIFPKEMDWKMWRICQFILFRQGGSEIKLACLSLILQFYLLKSKVPLYVLSSKSFNPLWDRYDVFLNQWVYKRSLSVARFSMGVTLSGSRVYCCGGEDELHRTLSTVEKYNILTDRWHSVLSMQCPRFGLVAASILLPALDEAPP